MSITVDTINLKFNIKPQYDQQQLNELKDDLKAAEKEFKVTAKEVEQSAKEYAKLNDQLKNMNDNRDRLAAKETRTPEEERQLTRLNKRIAEHNIKVQEQDKTHGELLKRYREQTLAMQEAQKKLDDYTKEIGLNKLSLNDLTQKQKELNTIIRQLNPGTEDFERYTAELKAVQEQMAKTKEEIYGTKETLEKTQGGWKSHLKMFNEFMFAINGALAIKDRIVAWADQYVQAFAKMDDAMTDVMKYTGQTKAEVEDMNEAFKQMTTRTAREELNALAGAAGRLGIQGKESIVGFVDAADKINVALGDDLGEGAIDQIGKLTMVFGEDKTKGLNGAMLATGSAINVLGANSSANTGFITEFTSSMAGMAVNAKISQTDIMGYASVLSQAGVEGQTASGVFAQLITKMFTDPAKFAKAARLDIKSFTDLLKTDANAAILQFLEGLKANGGFDALAPALKSLKMQGTQAVPVISSLINKMDELKKAQADARLAYDEGTSIIEEFNNANSSAQAQLEMAQKAMNDAASDLGKKLLPIVQTSINAGTASIKVISTLISFAVQHRTQLIALATTVAMLTTMWNAHAIQLAIVDGLNKAVALGNKALEASMLLLRNAGVALHATWALLTKGVQGYTVVMRAARLASLINPWTALATVLTVVGVAIYGMTKAWQSHARALREQDPAYRAMKAHAKDMQDINKRMNSETAKEISTIHHLTNVIRSNAYSVDERRAAIKRLEEIVPGYHANINKEGELIETNTSKLKEYINQLKATARAQAYADKLAEIAQEKLDNELELSRKQNNLRAVDAELNRGKNTTYKSNKKTYYRPSSTPGISGAEVEIETNDRLTKKLQERQKQQDAVNDRLKKQEELTRREQALTRQMEKDGIVRDVVVKGNKPATPTNPVPSVTNEESDKERNARQKKLQQERKEAEAEAKAAYEQELLEWKKLYQGRQGYEDEWQSMNLKAEEKYLAKKGDILRKYGAAQSDMQEYGNQVLDLTIKKANHEREVQQHQVNNHLLAEDREYAVLQIEEAQKRLNGEYNTEEEYNLKMLRLEIDHQRKMLEIKRAAGQDVTKEQKQLLDLEYQLQQRTYAKTEHDTQTAQKGNNDLLHLKFDETSSFDKMRELNEQYYRDSLISYQQYQENLSQIAQAESDKRQAIQQAAIDGVSNLLSSASQLFSAMQQRETAAVDAKYKKLIAAAKKQGKDTTKLEEQQEAEKQAIAKKYADRQFQIQVLQIVGNTAQGISKTIAELGMPWAVPFVAMAAAAGAMQLASAKAAADQASGLYSGGFSDDYQEGYTKKGDPRKQAGVIPVHQNEFVANHKAVANPNVRPVLDVIDRHQKVGDIQMLDSTRMLEEAYGRGRYRGGYVQQEAGGSSRQGESPQAPQPDNAEVMELLRTIARNTGLSLTVRGLRKEIRHEELLERNANR